MKYVEHFSFLSWSTFHKALLKATEGDPTLEVVSKGLPEKVKFSQNLNYEQDSIKGEGEKYPRSYVQKKENEADLGY